MRKLSLLKPAVLAAAFLTAQPAAANIQSINIFSVDSTANCEDTIGGSGCSPLGITLAGGVGNPFLNNLANKSVNLAPGSYYIFGNPYGGTSFMTGGAPISIMLTLDGGSKGSAILALSNATVPDLSVAGVTVFNLPSYGIKVTTTGITTADRMSFGYPPNAFAADGNRDFVLQLDYLVPSAAPEPAAWALMILGFAGAGAMLRRRTATA